MPFANPNLIVIRRDSRQRKAEPNVDDLVESISTVGQIQPIVVRAEAETLVLVVGERRTLACKRLGREVEYKLWSDLTPDEAEEVEFEENRKRQSLTWREEVEAIGRIHAKRRAADPTWTADKTAKRLSMDGRNLGRYLTVYANLASPVLAQAQDFSQAFSLLQRLAERRTASIVDELISAGQQAFADPTARSAPPADSPSLLDILQPPPMAGETQALQPTSNAQALETPESRTTTTGAIPPVPSSIVATAAPPPTSRPPAVLNTSFLSWAPTYTGPKFNLLHVDFPYGVRYDSFANSVSQRGELYESEKGDYDALLDCFCKNLSRFASYSTHLVFWFSMTYYAETKRKLEAAGFWVQEHPLIWLKSDNAGIVPGRTNEHPRRIYETAFLASIGKRTLVKAIGNAYAAPTASNPIHPSVKPEPVLRHFFSGLVDETTDCFDPTCGSGSALRAAEDCGARSVLGLELNAEFAKAAESLTQRARLMRRISK